MTKWRIYLDDPLMIHDDRSGYDDEADFLYLYSNDQKDMSMLSGLVTYRKWKMNRSIPQ